LGGKLVLLVEVQAKGRRLKTEGKRLKDRRKVKG
jgi:hypothetical protein